MYLEASSSGKPLYEKHGFESVEDIQIDLSPWGKNYIRTNTCMIRPASGPSTWLKDVGVMSATSEAGFWPVVEVKDDSSQTTSPPMDFVLPTSCLEDSARLFKDLFDSEASTSLAMAVDRSTQAIAA